MRVHVLLALTLLSMGAWSADKELELTDGRVLCGEVVAEQDGQVLLSVKVDGMSAQVRIPKRDVLSIKDAPAARVPAAGQAAADAAAQASAPVIIVRSTDTRIERVKRLLVEAGREAAAEDDVPPPYYGYPFPAWQHWPWVFMIGGNAYRHHFRNRHCQQSP